MAWGDAKRAGLALAAVLWDDRQLDYVAAHLAPSLTEAARRARPSPERTTPTEKIRALRDLTRQVRGEVQDHIDALPPRAQALLVRLVPRELGRRILRDSPVPRVDYSPPAELVSSLAHFARSLRGQDVAARPKQ